jgi:uncharacterized RDD family membrane protein YckC
MLDLLPSRRPPAPAVETAADRRVLLRRAVATAIDVVACYLLLVAPAAAVVTLLFEGHIEGFDALLVVGSLLFVVPVHMTYAFWFEWRYSRTPGKVARGLVVATADGKPCTFSASAIRNLLRYVDLLPGPYLVGLASALLSPRGQRLGDRAAGTVVVRATASVEGPALKDAVG